MLPSSWGPYEKHCGTWHLGNINRKNKYQTHGYIPHFCIFCDTKVPIHKTHFSRLLSVPFRQGSHEYRTKIWNKACSPFVLTMIVPWHHQSISYGSAAICTQIPMVLKEVSLLDWFPWLPLKAPVDGLCNWGLHQIHISNNKWGKQVLQVLVKFSIAQII